MEYTNGSEQYMDNSLEITTRNQEAKRPLISNEYSGEAKYGDNAQQGKNTESLLFLPINYILRKFSAGSILGSIFTLITATIGAGILALPNAMAVSGVAFGIFQILLGAGLGYYSTFLLVRCGDMAKEYSYQRLAIITYGKRFEFLVNFVMFVNNWGICVLYEVLINQLTGKALGILFGNALPYFMTDIQITWFWPPVFTTFVVFPICLFRELKSLRYFCLLGFFFILYLSIVLIFEALNPNICDWKANLNFLDMIKIRGITVTLPTVILAYMCHPNVLDVFQELQQSTKENMSTVLKGSMSLVCCLYTTVGLVGYLTFANNLDNMGGADILEGNYLNSVPITLAVLFIGFSVILAMPLSIKPGKDSLRDMIYEAKASGIQDSTLKHFILVSVTVYTQMFVSMLFTNVGTVIDFLGSSFYPMLCFIFPCMFFLKIDKSPKFSSQRVIAHTLNIVMIIFAIYSTVTFCLNCFENGKC